MLPSLNSKVKAVLEAGLAMADQINRLPIRELDQVIAGLSSSSGSDRLDVGQIVGRRPLEIDGVSASGIGNGVIAGSW